MKYHQTFYEHKVVGKTTTVLVPGPIEVVPPEEITVDEFNNLNEREQELYILGHEAFQAWCNEHKLCLSGANG